MLKYIDWNIKCYCKIDLIINYLKTKMSKCNCVVALQEVMPEKAEAIKAEFGGDYSVVYSLDYHPDNSEFDTDNRRLGVSFKMGKAVQYRRFAESVSVYKPDILSMDANEPKVDHYLTDKMVFFDQGDDGKGARTFFDELNNQNLVDMYLKDYNPSDYTDGEPLVVSHVINGKMNRRYDFIFAKKSLLAVA